MPPRRSSRPMAAGRVAPDGSPYPERRSPSFERDVQRMFTHIANGYDGFDHLVSIGQDLLWRPRAVRELRRFRGPGPLRRALDVGCGTGDLAALIAAGFPGGRVVGADFTRAMLDRARARQEGRPLEYARASALRLPFADAAFDLVSSAFVLRNFADLGTALEESRRVLRPGGVLLTLEITEPISPAVRRLFHAYFDRVVPALGSVVGSAGPYRYLPDSLRALPDRAAIVRAMERAGFDRVVAPTQSLGIVTTFLARAGPAA